MTAMMVGGGAFSGGGVGVGRGSLTPPSSSSTHHSLRLPSPQSPPSPASSDSPTSPASPGRSGGNKECGVCGDVAKSMHFGGLSCDSCKAFFRRSVQNNAHKGFTCPYEKKCVIAVSSRKACQYCRFRKCLSIGMEKGWVMTEDERRKMMQQRQERKTKEETKKQPPTPCTGTEKYSLSEEDRTEISIIVSLYKKAYQDVPYEESCPQEGPTGVMSPWMTFCKRIGYFFSLFREFADLSSSDQALLLKTAITSACIIMGSVVYDPSSGRWPGKGISRSGFVPNVTSQNVERIVPAELMSRVEHFFRKFQQVCPDETMAMILILVALYSPELMGLEAKDTIQALQDRYTSILQKYVAWKYKDQSSLMFPKVIVSLADIRELAERTSQMRIQQGVASSIPSMSSFIPRHDSHASSSSATPMEINEMGGATSRDEDIEDVTVKEECDLEDDDALRTEAAQKVARLGATGGVRDHTYQKIMNKIMDQMTSSSIHLRAPSLLPFIIQIVKKVGTGNSRDTSSQLPSASPKVGKTQQTKHQRIGSKRRMVEIKQEFVDEVCDSQELPSPIPTNTVSPNLHLSPHSHFNLQPEPNLPHVQQLHHLHHHQSSPSSPQSASGCMYPVSPMESTDSYDMLPPSPLQSSSPLHSSSLRLSPHSVPSPLSSNHSNDMMSPQPPLMVPVAPYTPPTAIPSPNILVKQPNMAPVADMPLPSPMAAPSPCSDTSSSSPESSQSPLSELFSEELSNVEIDVLTQLLDYVANIDNLDNVSSLKEILPPHLLSELQTKLCSYSLKHE
ncbi:uncharacterized protein LOC121867802 [Homarus americanus]|uniref:Thyroid hormone receptor beta-A-like n=1 Tax=Homarus americanus TaxID=6706 RepID=A0A8J5K548_HOMAM|nr:uncharacterized protein LOC121867802 [Homarus americanus]KAG7168041.1 Thyroid hormone receptor beta-A-like [Homarus americanus]